MMPAHTTYVEPFGGGMSVLLRKSFCGAEVYNDLDDEVVAFFRVLRDPVQGARLVELLRLTPYARQELAAAYEPSEDPVEEARRLVVRSFMGFGSDGVTRTHHTGFRSSSRRSTRSTPAIDWTNLADAYPALTKRLQGVVIECRSAFDLIPQHDGPDVLFYVDPPYVTGTRTRVCKGRGYRHELIDDDHVRLIELLRGVEGMVMLSGYACPLYEQRLGDWYRVDRAALADGAQPRTETLWANFDLAAQVGGSRDLFEGEA